MGIPDHHTRLLRNLYAGQEAMVRTGHGTSDWFHMQSTSTKMPSWVKHKLESRLLGEISIISDMQMTTPLWQKAEELKSLLMKVKEECGKFGLKLYIQKTKIMAFGLITS